MNEHDFGRAGSALGDVGGAGGSFAYSPDQLRDLVKEWTDLATDYQNSLRDAYYLTRVEGPGAELVSRSYASVANASGQAYLDSLQSRIDYCFAQAQKFQDALDDYLGQEHHSVTEITNSGPREGI